LSLHLAATARRADDDAPIAERPELILPKDITSRFRIKPGDRVRLAKRDPADTMAFPDKSAARRRNIQDVEAISKWQDRLYAEHSRALLVVLQGIDTAGKDGTITHVFKEVGPRGVTVTPFRHPTEEDLAHDFLWRAHRAVPGRGYIGIFNRSHYEDVLVGRVRHLAPPEEIDARYDQINDFEKLLSETGTVILKFMLHVSKDEQRKRLQARLDEREHRWKFNPGDIGDRKLWDEFQRAYELMLQRCSTAWAPWYVIPSDHKWMRNVAIAAIVRAKLEEMDPKYPKPDWNPGDFEIP
jgi:PPK2 family polyphosphate:nucleotide phosphotransferase